MQPWERPTVTDLAIKHRRKECWSNAAKVTAARQAPPSVSAKVRHCRPLSNGASTGERGSRAREAWR